MLRHNSSSRFMLREETDTIASLVFKIRDPYAIPFKIAPFQPSGGSSYLPRARCTDHQELPGAWLFYSSTLGTMGWDLESRTYQAAAIAHRKVRRNRFEAYHVRKHVTY